MSGQLYSRIARVTVGRPLADLRALDPNAFVFEGFDVQFTAEKTLTAEPSTLDLKVFNLAKTTRDKLEGKGWRVILEASAFTRTFNNPGFKQVFSGDARLLDHHKEGTDWITHIQCGDGERAYRESKISKSFQPGTSGKDIVKAVADALGIKPGNINDIAKQITTQYQNGIVLHGDAAQALERVLKAEGYSYSIQDGEIQAIAPDKPWAGTVPLLSPATGLIGSPAHGSGTAIVGKGGKPITLLVKSLLMPELRCGGKFRLESEIFKGNYYATKVKHTGTSQKGDWYTELESLPLAGG